MIDGKMEWDVNCFITLGNEQCLSMLYPKQKNIKTIGDALLMKRYCDRYENWVNENLIHYNNRDIAQAKIQISFTRIRINQIIA